MARVEAIKRILFVELLGGIGDVVIALPAIHALARSHPAAHLTVLTFAPGGALLQSDPLIHQVILAEPGQARQALDQLLRQKTFDLIVSDTNYDGIADEIANSDCKQVITNLWQAPPSNQWVGDRFLKILLDAGMITSEAASLNQPQIHLKTAERINARQALGAAYRPLVFLIPEAGMPIKRWSAQNFVTLGNLLRETVNATILVAIGSEPEQAAQIANLIESAHIVPRGSLRELAALIAEADLAIAADTGLARIAAALNVPTVTLFGPSWHGRYGQPAPHMNLQGFPACPERNISDFTQQPCWYSGDCPYDWHTCVDAISPKPS